MSPITVIHSMSNKLVYQETILELPWSDISFNPHYNRSCAAFVVLIPTRTHWRIIFSVLAGLNFFSSSITRQWITLWILIVLSLSGQDSHCINHPFRLLQLHNNFVQEAEYVHPTSMLNKMMLCRVCHILCLCLSSKYSNFGLMFGKLYVLCLICSCKFQCTRLVKL